MNNEERYEELRAERREELGVTKEQAEAIKQLLEANNYKVDMDYFWSVQPIYVGYENEPKASVQFGNGLFALHTVSSHWQYNEAIKFAEDVAKSMTLLNKIKEIAPTVVDPTFRNKRIEDEAAKHKAAMEKEIARWNALPERETILTLSTGEQLEQVRSKAQWENNRRVEFHIYYELDKRNFYIHSFIKRDGSIQRKKFADWHRQMATQDVEALIKLLPELSRKQNVARGGTF